MFQDPQYVENFKETDDEDEQYDCEQVIFSNLTDTLPIIECMHSGDRNAMMEIFVPRLRAIVNLLQK